MIPGGGALALSLMMVAGEDGAEAVPTFSGEIAKIVFENCTSCHRPGEVGPFPLTSYKEVRKRARMIDRVVRARIMPPWHPVEGHGEFEDELFLDAGELDSISRWVEGGMPEGDPEKTPPMPSFVEGWQLGEPDLIVQMPVGFEVPAGGRDIYRNFWVPVGLDEEKWITAIEVRPSSRAVLHHTLFSFDTTGEARRADGRGGKPGFSGMAGGRQGQGFGTSTSALGGWAVGGTPRHLPMGLARHLPAGSDIVLQSHFHPSGKAETEQTTLGLYFSDEPPERSMHALQLPPFFGIAAGLDIPAGEDDFELKEHFVLPCDAEAVTVGGHAHYLCTEMQVEVTYPGETESESIFYISDWDFDWQSRYQYAEPVFLPEGTRVDMRVRYDNSAQNPDNPHDPPVRVRWGIESEDEMGSITLLLVPSEEMDSDHLGNAIQRNAVEAMARSAQRRLGGREGRGRGLEGLLGGLSDRVKEMDRNGDGVITSDEIPQRSRRMVLRLDTNGDGQIDADEMAQLGGGGDSRRRDDRDQTSSARSTEQGEDPAEGRFRGVDGEIHRPLELGDAKANVIVFTTTDCPVANSYVPTLRALVKQHQQDPVRFFMVHVDPDTTADMARSHAKVYRVPGAVLRDPRHDLATRLGATITPEAVVLAADGAIAYRGRIDNLYGALGKKRQQASQHDLADALASVLAGKEVAVSRTEAIGCDLPVLPDEAP